MSGSPSVRKHDALFHLCFVPPRVLEYQGLVCVQTIIGSSTGYIPVMSGTRDDRKSFKLIGGSLPVLGMGTWRLGGIGDDPVAALRKGLERGMTLIDTAEAYGAGHSEELVREAIRGFERSELFIVSKVRESRATRDEIVEAARGSVARLGTYMDLYLLHWPPWDGNLRERMKGLEDVVKNGLAMHIGVSNFSVELIEEARSYLSTVEVAAVQNRMSVADKRYLRDVVPYTQRSGMVFMAYTPLETGGLASNHMLSQVAARYGKTAVQAALNWLICIEPVIPIPKAGKVKHVDEDAGAAGWRLSKEDWQLLNRSLD